MTARAEIPAAIRDATADQPAARVALAGAAAEPFHAYLFSGPSGTGKRAAARALAAELLAEGADDPDDARRRVLADPSPHPDLAWLRPRGTQHLVEDVRERVIAAAAYRPFEGERRAFVIEEAEAMAEESQNALLKTLEEPAAFAHLILISAEPEALLETVRSRCRQVRFARLAPEAIEEGLHEADADRDERRAAARLAHGDLDRARFLVSSRGRALRRAAEACVLAAVEGGVGTAPWSALLEAAGEEGERAAEAARAVVRGDEEAARPRAREADDAAKRAARRARTTTLDLGLALIAATLRDLVAIGDGAAEFVLNTDRAAELSAAAERVDPRRARRAAELVMDTRRRLTVNVSEELALEALHFRLEYLLAG